MRFGSWYLGIRDFGGGGPYGPSPFAEKYNFPTPIWMRSASAGALGRWGAGALTSMNSMNSHWTIGASPKGRVKT